MRPAMVSHNVALLVILAHELWMGSSLRANHEECGMHAITIEDSEHLWGIGWIGAVIKRQGNFRSMRVAAM